MRDALVKRELAELFFGLGDVNLPVSVESLETEIREVMGIGQDESLPGHRRFCEHFRETFQDEMFIEDDTSIPSDVKVTREIPCHLSYFGMCASRDAWCWTELWKLAVLLRTHVSECCEPGDFFKVMFAFSDGTRSVQWVCHAYHRFAKPPLALHAACTDAASDDGVDICMTGASVVEVVSSAMVVQRALSPFKSKHHTMTLVVREMTVAKVTSEAAGDILRHVAINEVSDAVTVFSANAEDVASLKNNLGNTLIHHPRWSCFRSRCATLPNLCPHLWQCRQTNSLAEDHAHELRVLSWQLQLLTLVLILRPQRTTLRTRISSVWRL